MRLAQKTAKLFDVEYGAYLFKKLALFSKNFYFKPQQGSYAPGKTPGNHNLLENPGKTPGNHTLLENPGKLKIW